MSKPPGDLTFSRDGELLISAGWGGMFVWHGRTGEVLLQNPAAACSV